MTLIPIANDKKMLSFRFRKADYFVFLDEDKMHIEENPHKTSKSPVFFDYFLTLGIDTLYIKALGYKTFVKLFGLNIKVYFIPDITHWNEIKKDKLILITKENAKFYCTLGHTSI